MLGRSAGGVGHCGEVLHALLPELLVTRYACLAALALMGLLLDHLADGEIGTIRQLHRRHKALASGQRAPLYVRESSVTCSDDLGRVTMLMVLLQSAMVLILSSPGARL